MSERHWSETGEKTSTAGITVLLALFQLGGRTLFHLSLWPVIVFYWLVSPTARHASRTYLTHMARVRGTRPPSAFSSLAHLVRFADTILDKLLAVSGFFSAKDLAVEGLEGLFEDPRGALLVTAHTGCLELCQFIGEARLAGDETLARRHVYVLTHTVHAVRFNALIAKLNPKFAVRHLQVSDVDPQTAVELSELIDAGHWVVIVADRTPIGSNAALTVPFLGEEAPVAMGPFLLAVLLKCPVWSMICTRQTAPESAAHYRVDFAKLFEGGAVPRSRRSAVIRETALAWVRQLEAALVKSPIDWFNFFDFWHPAQSARAQHARVRHEAR